MASLEFLLYVLTVELYCVVQAGKLLQTQPTEAGVTMQDADVFSDKLELNVSGRAPKKCRRCRRDFFRTEVTNQRHSSPCNMCRPCTVCAYDEQVTAPCTSIQDTECTPLCGDDDYFDRVTRTCQTKVIVRHELVFEEPTDRPTSTIGSKTVFTALADRVINQPSVGLKTFGRANQGNHGSSRVVEAESEESVAYMTSLFTSGAAGIAVLVLLVFIFVYVVLRIKQWLHYKQSLRHTDTCHCALLPCCVHCINGNGSESSNVQTDYSITGNRSSGSALLHGHQQRRMPIGIKVTRVKASTESKSTLGIDSKECQEGSSCVEELQKNRQADTESSQINRGEHGIEGATRTSCEAVPDQFQIPKCSGVDTVILQVSKNDDLFGIEERTKTPSEDSLTTDDSSLYNTAL